MEPTQLNALFQRYLRNNCSPEEVSTLFQYFETEHEPELRMLVRQALQAGDQAATGQHLQQSADEVYARIRTSLFAASGTDLQTGRIVQLQRRKIWSRVAVAASLLIVIGGAALMFRPGPTRTMPAPVAVVKPAPQNLEPGGNKAILVLSSGKQINLNNAANGELAKDDRAIIRKTADGRVLYETASSTPRPAAVAYNVLSTPRGGKYDLTLSDGTRVWLNAASSVKYPTVFTGNNRSVEITGEAYFEVAHDASRPFTVTAAGQTIEVLGTHFNINAYSDEPSIKTTLLEGSVKISNGTRSAVLQPGQQAIVHPDQRIVINKDADLEEAMAWHQGLFKFQEADIKAVMRQLSRWYDVDVSYEGEIPKRLFSGKIYRNITALKVADVLAYKQIHFRIEGRKIIVMP